MSTGFLWTFRLSHQVSCRKSSYLFASIVKWMLAWSKNVFSFHPEHLSVIHRAKPTDELVCHFIQQFLVHDVMSTFQSTLSWTTILKINTQCCKVNSAFCFYEREILKLNSCTLYLHSPSLRDCPVYQDAGCVIQLWIIKVHNPLNYKTVNFFILANEVEVWKFHYFKYINFSYTSVNFPTEYSTCNYTSCNS